MQIFFPDNLPSLVRGSVNTLTLASTNMLLPTTVTVGGQQYVVPSTLTLSTLSVGANGLDAGSLGANQLWYVYAIVNQSTLAVALLASLTAPSSSPTYPSGYGTVKKLVGAFYTNGSSQVDFVETTTGLAVGTATTTIPVGLLQAGAIPGVVDGSAAATGYVGEYLTVSFINATVGTGTWLTGGAITLTTGSWLVSATVLADSVATQTGFNARLYVKGAVTDVLGYDYLQARYAAAGGACVTFTPRVVNVAAADADKNIEINTLSITATGYHASHISAVRIR